MKVGEKKDLIVNIPLTDEDIENNPNVNIKAYYGERERSLIKILQGEYEFSLAGFGYMTGQVFKDLGAGAVVYGPMIIILILLFLVLGMKKKCPNCKEINNVRAKHCKKCNEKI
ncbi:hypothetical protein HN415_04810 [Candidatus Woesearchaeota archaeon]|nr:hypothetical protein [Candidatus Woesearchaeota archaeon]